MILLYWSLVNKFLNCACGMVQTHRSTADFFSAKATLPLRSGKIIIWYEFTYNFLIQHNLILVDVVWNIFSNSLYKHTYTHTRTHTYTHLHTPTHTYTHTSTHTQTHTAHTYTHTHALIHTEIASSRRWPFQSERGFAVNNLVFHRDLADPQDWWVIVYHVIFLATFQTQKVREGKRGAKSWSKNNRWKFFFSNCCCCCCFNGSRVSIYDVIVLPNVKTL